ncbi:MAG: transglycosylase SLT domain-containing protein [Candidatus Binataceae bacterium]
MTAAVVAALVNIAPAYAETQVAFPRPAAIEPNIQFWVDVFTGYSRRDFVLIDRRDISRVYQVHSLAGSGEPSAREIEWVNVYLKSKWTHVLEKVASGREPSNNDERRVAEMFTGNGSADLPDAIDNLRVQQGLRERFREGLVRSRQYRPSMERIFRAAGLPPELVVLAQVESGFHPRARSHAGAVGIWQFRCGTGRVYMKIRRGRDDRLNPTRATKAAAEHLRDNYQRLGNWPLAITAYNYGVGGMARAASAYDYDYEKVVESYQGPRFGFAVRNYYSEFLAALQVHRYENAYFPELKYASPASVAAGGDYTVKRGDTFARIARQHGVSVERLMRENGIKNAKALRAGSTLTIPLDS